MDLIIQTSSDKDSVVLDCFAGSGETLLSANRNQRKWIGIDESDSSIKLIKKRLGSSEYICDQLIIDDNKNKI